MLLTNGGGARTRFGVWSLYSEVPCLVGGGGRARGWGWGSLYGEVQCITGNGHMGLLWRHTPIHTHTTETITFPQLRCRVVINTVISLRLCKQSWNRHEDLRFIITWIKPTCLHCDISWGWSWRVRRGAAIWVLCLTTGLRRSCTFYSLPEKHNALAWWQKETSKRVHLFWLKTVTSLLVETSRKLIAQKMSLPL